jgi:hypothetical protein
MTIRCRRAASGLFVGFRLLHGDDGCFEDSLAARELREKVCAALA